MIDTDPVRPRREVFTGLGLHPAHPAYLVDVVRAGSRLVDVLEPPWLPGPDLSTLDGRGRGGADRWQLITPGDFFGGLPHGDDTGVHGARLPDRHSGTGDCGRTRSLCSRAAACCARAAAARTRGSGFRGLHAAGRRRRAHRPARARTRRPAAGSGRAGPTSTGSSACRATWPLLAGKLGLVALLDVPPGLLPRQVLRWRSRLESSSAAAYHPWLRVTGPDPAGPLVALPPSAVAAGILARCELRDGVGRGAANEPAAGVVDVAEVIEAARHAELHRLGINVFRPEPGAIMLTAARTLAADPAWRQLSVRRLLLLVERVVRRRLQWAVFEPDDAALRAGAGPQPGRSCWACSSSRAPWPARPRPSRGSSTIAAGGPHAGTVIVRGRGGGRRAGRVHRGAGHGRRRGRRRVGPVRGRAGDRAMSDLFARAFKFRVTLTESPPPPRARARPGRRRPAGQRRLPGVHRPRPRAGHRRVSGRRPQQRRPAAHRPGQGGPDRAAPRHVLPRRRPGRPGSVALVPGRRRRGAPAAPLRRHDRPARRGAGRRRAAGPSPAGCRPSWSARSSTARPASSRSRRCRSPTRACGCWRWPDDLRQGDPGGDRRQAGRRAETDRRAGHRADQPGVAAGAVDQRHGRRQGRRPVEDAVSGRHLDADLRPRTSTPPTRPANDGAAVDVRVRTRQLSGSCCPRWARPSRRRRGCGSPTAPSR